MINENNDLVLRPQQLDDYVGQENLKTKLRVYINAAQTRDEVLDHMLFYGPPGLGKTTLAGIMANEMHARLININAGGIEKVCDLISILTSIEEGNILFIDEIHRLPPYLEEILYSAMEDYRLDIVMSNSDSSKVVSIDLPPFTLIGATTKLGNITFALRTRFSIIERLDYYKESEISHLILRTANVLKFEIDKDAVNEIVIRSRGTPRLANNFFRRVRDYCIYKQSLSINKELTKQMFDLLKINEMGLDEIDIKILRCLCINFKDKAVGISVISNTIDEDNLTIENVHEPYLVYKGYLLRTKKGRMITSKGMLAVSEVNT